ncbi:MAG: hypothetical protein M9947_11110 [Thermomicrobiales bacterium]|nr:hypothetical protein [Thermomicrobiales bacterium]
MAERRVMLWREAHMRLVETWIRVGAAALLVMVGAIGMGQSRAHAQDATPSTGIDRYVSEQFGYQISWPDDWTYVTSQSEPGGYDLVVLIQGDMTANIVMSRPGDTPLSEIVGFLAAGPDDARFVPGVVATDAEGNEIHGETADRAWGAFLGNYMDEVVDGFMEFRYAEIRRLDGDLGVGLSLEMPATDFDHDVSAFSLLLDGVTKVEAGDATPPSMAESKG